MANLFIRDAAGATREVKATETGAVHVPAHQITNAAGTDTAVVSGGLLSVNGSGVTQPVSGTVAATQSGTWNIGTVTVVTSVGSLTNALPAGDNNIGNVDLASAIPAGTNNIGDVDILSIAAGDNNIGNVDIASIAAGDNNIGNVDIVTMPNAVVAGDVANDTADSGNPVKVGGKAIAGLSGLTLVTANDRVNWNGGLDGAQIVRTHCALEDIVSGNASNTDGTVTTVIASAGAGIKQYLTKVILTNSSATFAYVEILSGAVVKATIPVPATSGATVSFDPPLPPNAADETWRFDPSAATTTLYCSAVAFKSKI